MSKTAKYSTMAILLIPIGIAINYVGGQIALILKLPVFHRCHRYDFSRCIGRTFVWGNNRSDHKPDFRYHGTNLDSVCHR
jgi:hypothetical protein